MDAKQTSGPPTHNLHIFEGSVLGTCHRVEGFLGEGGYGVVTKCRNAETNQAVAIKVNKNNGHVVRQTRMEISILKQLRRLDADACSVVTWHGFFFDSGRICLSFELLDQSLRDYMGNRGNVGLPVNEVRAIIHQVTTAVSHLNRLGIIHADLKPENIMVVDHMQQPLRVKLIDFGLARPVSAFVPGVCVQTTWYRAPEVILLLPCDEAIDMWSVGVTAAELATGWALYPGNMDYDVLNFIIETQGQFPDHILNQGMGTYYFFERESNNRHKWRFLEAEQFYNNTGFKPSDTRNYKLRHLDELEFVMANDTRSQSDRSLLVDLIKGMLQLDPNQRITPQEVKQHPFLSPSQYLNSTADTSPETQHTEKQTPEVSQQSSSHIWTRSGRSGGEESDMIHRSVESHTADDVIQSEQETTVEIPHETKAENNRRPGHITRRIADTFSSFFTTCQ